MSLENYFKNGWLKKEATTILNPDSFAGRLEARPRTKIARTSHAPRLCSG